MEIDCKKNVNRKMADNGINAGKSGGGRTLDQKPRTRRIQQQTF